MEAKRKRVRDKDRKNVDRETLRVYGGIERKDNEREREYVSGRKRLRV